MNLKIQQNYNNIGELYFRTKKHMTVSCSCQVFAGFSSKFKSVNACIKYTSACTCTINIYIARKFSDIYKFPEHSEC